ncbi:hypothetical protein [Mycobacterium mantenii]|nr:hypothetical protein [Mycobacterium mantenii]
MGYERLAWIGTTMIALTGIIIGVLPLDAGPRWVWLIVGIALGIAVAVTYPRVWPKGSSRGTPQKPVKQRLTTGKGSRVIQAGGDVDLKGGMGDHK